MSYRMVLWDFDGTLADTWASGLQVFNEIAGEFNLPRVTTLDEIRRMSTKEFLGKQGVSLFKLPRLVRAWHAGMRSRMDSVALYPGILEVLQGLKTRGCRLGILSSNATDNIQICLRSQGAADLFDCVQSSPRLFGKSHGIKGILKEQQIAAEQTLYVGDEVRDIEAARKAGVDSAAVCWGLHTRELLSQESPTHVVERPSELTHLNPARPAD